MMSLLLCDLCLGIASKMMLFDRLGRVCSKISFETALIASIILFSLASTDGGQDFFSEMTNVT